MRKPALWRIWSARSLRHARADKLGSKWCPWPDSNQHGVNHLILSQARLPIPPQGHFFAAQAARIIAAQNQGSTATNGGPKASIGRFQSRRSAPMIRTNPAIRKETAMNEEALNMSLRKFLKVVGVTSQQEIEKAIRAAVADGRLKGSKTVEAQMVLTIGKVGLNHKVNGTIELE